MPPLPDVIGLRQTEALALLEKTDGAVTVRVIQTRPPKSRHGVAPVAWRVICVRQHDDEVVLIVAPEWLPYKTEDIARQAGETE